MSKFVLALKNIEIHELNALTNAYTVGFPGITNFVGLGKSLEMKFKQVMPQAELSFNNIAIIIHKFQLINAHPKYTRYRKDEISLKGNTNASIVDIRQAHATLTLFILFEVCDKYLDDYGLNFQDLINDFKIFVEANIRKFKVAGGITYKTEEIIAEQFNQNTKDKLFKSVPNDSFILGSISEEMPNSIEETLQLFNKSPHNPDKAQGIYWLLQIGYKLLENPTKKYFSRNEYEHAFVEPILAPVRLYIMSSLTHKELSIWWQYDNSQYKQQKLLLTTAQAF